MTAKIIPLSETPVELAYKRGRMAFRRGRPNIKNTWNDEQWSGACNEGQAFWLGWMIERGLGIMKKVHEQDRDKALKDWAERGGPLPPDFCL